ncbi:hypothetical protein [Dysosmobacter sp.]|uniref:hypothetical protein n=1 Tax=Dysosmobacter sp. TaxID=2591382 RepID=UPI002A8BB4C4|nr:hypothetical protein [Dysosmobacter sp.]MDY3281518.1 hypothetical protein [Dysosmobacter sp.]
MQMDENTSRIVESLRQNPAAVQALFQSRDGQALLRMLTEGDRGASLQKAAQSASRGDAADMVRMMKQVMQSKEGAALVDRINKTVRK